MDRGKWRLVVNCHVAEDDELLALAADQQRVLVSGDTDFGTLLALPQTWGAIAARALTDPVWFMIADWFAIYLASIGFDLEQTAEAIHRGLEMGEEERARRARGLRAAVRQHGFCKRRKAPLCPPHHLHRRL